MKTKLTSWTLAHFAVDMSCFYILFRGVETVYRTNEPDLLAIGIAIMVYNCIAFGAYRWYLAALPTNIPASKKP